MPGTLIPIVDESRLFTDQPECAIIFSWHIAEELDQAPPKGISWHAGDATAAAEGAVTETQDTLHETHTGPSLLRSWIEAAANRDPEKPYVVSVDDGRALSFGDLRLLTRRIAAFLHEREIRANDRVALLANNSIEHLACYFGVMAYGATICTIHIEMNRNHLDNIFARLKPHLILYQAGLELDDLLAEVTAPCLPLGSWLRPAPGTLSVRSLPARRAMYSSQARGRRTPRSSSSPRAPATDPRAWS